jgi:hypothetical protein
MKSENKKALGIVVLAVFLVVCFTSYALWVWSQRVPIPTGNTGHGYYLMQIYDREAKNYSGAVRYFNADYQYLGGFKFSNTDMVPIVVPSTAGEWRRVLITCDSHYPVNYDIVIPLEPNEGGVDYLPVFPSKNYTICKLFVPLVATRYAVVSMLIGSGNNNTLLFGMMNFDEYGIIGGSWNDRMTGYNYAGSMFCMATSVPLVLNTTFPVYYSFSLGSYYYTMWFLGSCSYMQSASIVVSFIATENCTVRVMFSDVVRNDPVGFATFFACSRIKYDESYFIEV